MSLFPNRFRMAALLLPAALLAAAPQEPATAPPSGPPPAPPAMPPPAPAVDGETYQGEAPERYAMVRVVEGEVSIRKGDVEEALTRGTPVAEGDVVESRGRGVLQLGDGTRLAFGGATRFTVAALFSDRQGGKQVLLRLDYGRLRVQMGGQSEARFRVDTASGTATCFDKGAFTVEAERDRLVRLMVHTGHAAFANERDEARLSAGERLTVYSPQDNLDRVRSFNTFDGDEFDRWSERAVVVKRGESWERVPSEIRYYADDLDSHGRWVQSDEYGWVWQPNGVAEDWRPYSEGRWAPYAGGMTWVSAEPWGYVAYHHGRWQWGVGFGWFWIPGVYYSPAWVAWHHTPGYYGWAPLGYYNTPCHWGYGAWGGGYAWNVVAVAHINVVNVHTHIYTDATVIRTFNGAPAPAGGRPLSPPWQRTPLVVSHTEFRNPGQIQTAFRQDVNRERLGAYERQAQAATGRTFVRREVPSAVSPTETRLQAPYHRPFEDPGPRRPLDPRPAAPLQPSGRWGGEARPMPAPGGQAAPRPEPGPRDRSPESRPVAPTPRDRFVEERRAEPAPRERSVEPRPLPGRPAEYAPRERPVEPRASAPQDRRPDPQPRPVDREARQAPRPEPARPAERENRPATRPDPARERPKEEHKKEERH